MYSCVFPLLCSCLTASLLVQASKGDFTSSSPSGSTQELLPYTKQWTFIGWRGLSEQSPPPAVFPTLCLFKRNPKAELSPSLDFIQQLATLSSDRKALSARLLPHLAIFPIRLCIQVLAAFSKSQGQRWTCPPRSDGLGLWRVSLPVVTYL